jgi:hypothetical protein
MTARIPENVSTDWTIVTINTMPPRDPNEMMTTRTKKRIRRRRRTRGR